MSAAQTRFIVDEDDHLHLLHFSTEDADLCLPLYAYERRDLHLPLSMLPSQDLLLCPFASPTASQSICFRNRPRAAYSRRIMVEDTLHHERWLRFLPRAPRVVN